MLIKNGDQYTLIFPQIRLDMDIARSEEEWKKQKERMDYAVSGRRTKVDERDKVGQTKQKAVAELPEALNQ